MLTASHVFLLLFGLDPDPPQKFSLCGKLSVCGPELSMPSEKHPPLVPLEEAGKLKFVQYGSRVRAADLGPITATPASIQP